MPKSDPKISDSNLKSLENEVGYTLPSDFEAFT